jgi:predicted negative regulator of RcsB-dependent stress response
MMIRSRGPVWHQKQKKQGIIPKGLAGIDKEATWGKSKAKNWIYGHGSFMLTSYQIPIVGIFQWMPNSANEAKRMETEIAKYHSIVKKVFMDSKADDQKLYFRLKKQYHI